MSDNKEQKLWDAASKGDCQAIRILAMEGVDINARNEDGFTAFSLATANGHADAAMTILAAREMQFARQLGEDPAEFFKIKEAPKKVRRA